LGSPSWHQPTEQHRASSSTRSISNRDRRSC
jgi:hypothetical protein